jgi:hypothetical protein
LFLKALTHGFRGVFSKEGLPSYSGKIRSNGKSAMDVLRGASEGFETSEDVAELARLDEEDLRACEKKEKISLFFWTLQTPFMFAFFFSLFADGLSKVQIGESLRWIICISWIALTVFGLLRGKFDEGRLEKYKKMSEQNAEDFLGLCRSNEKVESYRTKIVAKGRFVRKIDFVVARWIVLNEQTDARKLFLEAKQGLLGNQSSEKNLRKLSR